jgi:hypothetical protein
MTISLVYALCSPDIVSVVLECDQRRAAHVSIVNKIMYNFGPTIPSNASRFETYSYVLSEILRI